MDLSLLKTLVSSPVEAVKNDNQPTTCNCETTVRQMLCESKCCKPHFHDTKLGARGSKLHRCVSFDYLICRFTFTLNSWRDGQLLNHTAQTKPPDDS